MEHLLKDIRVTRLGDSEEWQLGSVPRAARLALEAIGLKFPEILVDNKSYSPASGVTG